MQDEDSRKVRGIQYNQHYPKDFILPYGEAVKDSTVTEVDINKKFQPFTCKWLNRPGIAISESLDTLEKNIGAIAKMNKLLKNKPVINQYLEFQQELIQGKFSTLWE